MNTIDASALESLVAVDHRLKDGGITLHLSEVKGPVMDLLKRSHFLRRREKLVVFGPAGFFL